VDAEGACGTRLWNNANVLCLLMRVTSGTVAEKFFNKWYETAYESHENDDNCLEILDIFENS
jgi:ribose 5-phosphate isomerase B